MRVLAVTKIFPNAAEPLSSPFNRQQFAALGRRCELEVLATIPWFPGAALLGDRTGAAAVARVPRRDRIDGLEVAHPRVLYVPRFGHALSAALYAASVLPALLRRRGRFDVLLGAWAYPDGVAVAALGKALRIPTVVKLHGSDIDVLGQRPALRRQMSLALPRATRVVAVSRKLAEAVIAMGVPPGRVDIVWNGVDRALFHPRDRAEARAALGRAGDTRRWILCVGDLKPDKGTGELVAAFQRVVAAHPDTVLALVGDGPSRAAAEEALRPLGDRAIFAGMRPLKEVPVWMGACDLLTLPSHHEGTPNVLLEALACGRRLVGTDVGGIPDVISRPELGSCCPPHDADALAAALSKELEVAYDPATIVALGGRGSWDDSAGHLYETLERAVAQDAAGGGGST